VTKKAARRINVAKAAVSYGNEHRGVNCQNNGESYHGGAPRVASAQAAAAKRWRMA